MRLLEWIADAGMAACKDTVSFALHPGWIELQIHQFVHVLENSHVAVQLDNSVIFDQGERRQLAPAIVKSWVIGEVLRHRRQQVLHSLLGDVADLESAMAFWRQGVCVERDKGIS